MNENKKELRELCCHGQLCCYCCFLIFPSFFDIVINGDNIETHKQTDRHWSERVTCKHQLYAHELFT